MTNKRQGAYHPNIPAKRPGAHPEVKPKWRVLMHHKHEALWVALPERVGMQNAQRLWDHLAMQPDQRPKVGSVTPMKGRHNRALADGSSRVYHYEVSGAGRVDYRYNPRHKTQPDGDEHPVVTIISIDLSSH